MDVEGKQLDAGITAMLGCQMQQHRRVKSSAVGNSDARQRAGLIPSGPQRIATNDNARRNCFQRALECRGDLGCGIIRQR